MKLSPRTTTCLLAGVLGMTFITTGIGVDANEFTRRSGGKAVTHQGGKIVHPAHKAEARTSWIGHTSLEPTIGINPAGDIFMTAGAWSQTPGVRSGGATEIVKSEDGAKTWSFVTPKLAADVSRQHVSLDPYVWVDDIDGDNARVFTIDLTVACSYMSFSDDGGETWTTNPLACGRPVNDHQTLFSGPPVSSTTFGYPNIVYYCWNDVGTSSCSKSLDGGITFHPTGAPSFLGYDNSDDGGFCGGLHGHGIVDSKGTVFLPREYCGRPFVSISKDEGLTWTNVRIAKMEANGGSDTSVAVDKKGNLYYLFLGDDRLPYLSVSRDGGKKWSKPSKVAPPGVKEANLPSIDARGNGKIALVYYGSENSPFVPCEENCPNFDYLKTRWNGYLTISANALAKKPLFYTGLVNDRADPLVRQRCGPGRCHNVLDFVDVTIGRDGIAYGAFVDTCMPENSEPACTEENPTNAGAFSGSYEGLVTRIVGGPSLN